jgi:hypothetical protein
LLDPDPEFCSPAVAEADAEEEDAEVPVAWVVSTAAVDVMTLVEVTPSGPEVTTDVITVDGCWVVVGVVVWGVDEAWVLVAVVLCVVDATVLWGVELVLCC